MTIERLSLPEGIPTLSKDPRQVEEFAAVCYVASDRNTRLEVGEHPLELPFLEGRSFRYDFIVGEDGNGTFRAMATRQNAQVLRVGTDDSSLRRGGATVAVNEENPLFVLTSEDSEGNAVLREIFAWLPNPA